MNGNSLYKTHYISNGKSALVQDDDIPGIVRYHTYEVLKEEVNNPKLRWAYLPYSMHMAGPREAIQHMIIRKNYGEQAGPYLACLSLDIIGYVPSRGSYRTYNVATQPTVKLALEGTPFTHEHEAWLQDAPTSSLAGTWRAARVR